MVMRASKYYNLHMFLSPFRSFLIVSKFILCTFRGFVAGVLGEAKKRKISKRGENFLL